LEYGYGVNPKFEIMSVPVNVIIPIWLLKLLTPADTKLSSRLWKLTLILLNAVRRLSPLPEFGLVPVLIKLINVVDVVIYLS
jgi:hypothetical protein